MLKINLSLIGLVSVLLSSCVVDLNDKVEFAEKKEVRFLSNPFTRGTILTNPEEISMGVFAYATGLDQFTLGIAYPQEMDNRKMSHSITAQLTDAWNYAPRQFWPQDVNDKMSFFAYTPYATSENGVTLNASPPGHLPVLTYEVPLQAEKQPDLRVAIPQTDLTQRNSDVKFEFKEVLSSISFFVEGAGIQIKGIAVSGIKTRGQLSLGLESEGRVGAPFDYRIRWNLDDAISELDYSAGLAFDEGKTYLTTTSTLKNMLNEDGILMMLPQSLTSRSKIILTLSDGTRKEFPLNQMADRWQAGGHYQYKLKWVGSAN